MSDMKRIVLAAVVMIVVAATLIVVCTDGSEGASSGTIPEDMMENTYSVTFNGNEGTSRYGETAIFDVKGGTNSIELPVTTWTREGYYLTGWYSLVHDKDYALNETYKPTSADILTAQWRAFTDDLKSAVHKSEYDDSVQYGDTYVSETLWTTTTYTVYGSGPTGTKIVNVKDQGYYRYYNLEWEAVKKGVFVFGDGVYRWTVSVPSTFDVQCTLTYYDGNPLESSSSVIGSITVPTGTAVNLKTDGNDREGYHIKAWKINDSAGSRAEYALGSSFTVRGDYSAEPVMEGDANVAIFIVDGGVLKVRGFVIITDQKFETLAEDSVVEKPGKDFIGWLRIDSEGNNDSLLYAPKLTMTSSESLIFLAYYVDSSVADATYTVTFDANGGTGGISQRVGKGMSCYLPTDAQVSYDGYIFNGWNVGTDKTIYAGGTTYTPTFDVTLKVNWKQATVPPSSVTFTTSSASVRKNESIKLVATTDKGDVRGVKFVITQGDGVYAEITSQDTTSTGGYCYIQGLKQGSITVKAYSIINADAFDTKTITVKGELNVFTISYNANSGYNVPDQTTTSSEYTSADLTVTMDRPSKTGWTFKTWNTSSDGKGVDYAPGQKVSLPINGNNTLMLYALWTQNPHTYYLEYNLGKTADGTSAPGSITTQAYGTEEKSHEFTISSETPGWVGYKFLGWSETAIVAGIGETSDVKYNPGDKVTVTQTADTSQTSTTKTLYAVWADNYNEYRLELDPMEGQFSDGTSESKIYTIKLVAASYSYQIPIGTDPTKEGAEFVGWSASGSAVLEEGDKIYYAGDYVALVAKDNAASIILKAIWSDGQGSHKIIFEENAGTDTVTGMPTSVSATTVNGFSSLKIPDAKPIRQTSGDSFYIFAGWKDGISGKTYYSGTVQSATDLTFQAVWMPFKLTLDGNRATLTNGGATVGVEVYIDWLGDGNVSGSMSGTQKTATYGYSEKGTYEVKITLAVSGKGFETSVTRTLTVESDQETFAIAYHSNNGKDLTEYQYGVKVKTMDSIFDAPNGLKFDSWNTEADGSGKKYSAGSTITLTADLDLYAQWSENGSNDDGDDGGMPVWVIAIVTVLILIAGFVIVTRVI